MPESHIALPSAPRHACTHIGIGQSALTQPRSLGQAVLLHKRCALLSDPLFFFFAFSSIGTCCLWART